VGKYEGKIIDLLEDGVYNFENWVNLGIHVEDDLLDAGFNLTDKDIVVAKMKIVLSGISGPVDDIEEFMKKVDDDVCRLKDVPGPNTLSTISQVLNLTQTIMDQFAQVAHFFTLLVNPLSQVNR
jgi:hypothetical protein